MKGTALGKKRPESRRLIWFVSMMFHVHSFLNICLLNPFDLCLDCLVGKAGKAMRGIGNL